MTEQEISINYVYSVAISPAFNRDHTCFAAQQSGLYRSRDAGHNWQNVIASLSPDKPLATQVVVFSPDFEHDHMLFATSHGGILRSIDSGESWQIHLLPEPPPFASTFVLSPNYALDGQAFSATMEDGIFCSRDRGGHWATWNFGLLDLEVLSLVISPRYKEDDTLIAGTESGIYRSKNGGRAWRVVNIPFEVGAVTSLAFALDDSMLFAGTANGELLCSNDHGTSWSLTAHFEDGIDQIMLGHDFAQSPNILLLSGSVLYSSSNAGQNWEPHKGEMARTQAISCFAAPNGDFTTGPILAGTADQGVVVII
jgi:photosystem II stability/assembly factor-like uncharacterized protein